MNDRYSKLAFLHRLKERKTPSSSAQASFAPFSLKVAWSGKSLIDFGVLKEEEGVPGDTPSPSTRQIYPCYEPLTSTFPLVFPRAKQSRVGVGGSR